MPDNYEYLPYDDGYEAGHKTALQESKMGLAATLTRLRSTVAGDGANEDDRGYLRALEHIASAHGIKSETVTTVTYVA